MKETIKHIFCNPLGTLAVGVAVSSIMGGVASIIRAVKSDPENPGISITMSKPETEKV